MREKLEQLIERLGGQRRAAIMGAGVGAVLLILGVSWWATAPEWVPLYSGVPLESVGPMTQKLDEAKIAYRLEQNGSALMVATSDVAKARVTLAQGGMPAQGRPGMELFDQPSWGMTDFTQRINYRRALEGELERTIGKMRGVQAAQVHLAMQENASFRRPEGPSEASVVLQLQTGQRPAQDVVQGIQYLVSSSVGGLQSDNVMILDDAGRLLSAPNEPGSIAALTNRQLEMQREVERHLEQKAQELLDEVVGPGNARIQVAAEVNFDRIERTVESIDADGQVAASEQTSEIIPGPQGGAGSRTANTTYDNPRKLETFSGSVGGLKRVTVGVLVNEKQAAGAAGQAQRRTPQELQQIQTLVERAVGYNAQRGDEVSVVSLAFTAPVAAPASPVDWWALAQDLQRPVLTLVALLLAFFVTLRLIRTLRPPAPAEVPTLAAAGAPLALPLGEFEAEGGEENAEALPAPRRIPMLPSSAERVETMIDEQPEVAARLIRTWLQEGNV